MTSSASPKLLPSQLQSPSHYSNRAREKRCTRAKELLVELIKTQTTHHVDPKDIKTTKPSSTVSWRFEVEPGTEFPFVQLSSISRPNLDLLEKAVEGGGVRVVWTSESGTNTTDDDGRFPDSKRPRKRTKHSTDSDGGQNLEGPNVQPQSQPQLQSHLSSQALSLPPISQAPVNFPPAPGAGPSTSFTTVNGPPAQLNNIQQVHPQLAAASQQPQPQLAIASYIQNGNTSTVSPTVSTSSMTPTHTNGTISSSSPERTISIDIPISSISRILASERNSLIDSLRGSNARLTAENERMKTEIATIQSKYNALEEQLRKKMSQIQEILGGGKAGDVGGGEAGSVAAGKE